MNKYLNFKIGDKVQLLNNEFDYSTLIPAGTIFTIKKFVPCTIPGKYKYFIFSEISGTIIRTFVNNVIKVK